MDWLFKMLNTSIGKKMLVGLTGLFLCSFLLVHLYINFHLTFNAQEFNELAHFMGTTLIIRIMEIGLFLGIVLHIASSLWINKENRAAKPIKYAVNAGSKTSTWTSRNMVLLGLVLLLFLILHLYQMYIQHKFIDTETPLAELTVTVLRDPVYSILYLVAFLTLGLHLKHGFESACQTFGIKTPKMTGLIKSIGVIFWLLIPALFIWIDIYFAFLGGKI